MNLSLSKLTHFPDLSRQRIEEVSAEANYIRVIPEDCLPRGIKRLRLSWNSIGSDGLPVNFPDSLEVLDLRRNRITDFREVEHFPDNLRELNIGDNPIESLEFLNQIQNLQQLDVSRTRLEWLSPLAKTLIHLQATKCYILRMLPNRLPPSIRIVHLSDCDLRYAGLPGYWGDQLEELNLAFNKIEKFPRNLPSSLKTLNLTGNRIQQIPNDMNERLPNLEVLFLGSNRIREVPMKYRRKKILLAHFSDNELTKSLHELNTELLWAEEIDDRRNWNTAAHEQLASRIQKNWRVSRIHRRIRIWRRTRVLKEELFCVSMMPERVWQTDVLSNEWKRD